MKHTDAGFTLMETLLSVAIILIISGLIVVSSGTALKGASLSFKTSNTAATIIRVDRHIRRMADNVHIPYWADSQLYIDNFTAELYRSNIGKYVKSVKTITQYPKAPRGVEVIYSVNNQEIQTAALFSSIAIMDAVR